MTGKTRTDRGISIFTRVNDLPVEGWITTSNGRRTGDVADDMMSQSDVTLKRGNRQTGWFPNLPRENLLNSYVAVYRGSTSWMHAGYPPGKDFSSPGMSWVLCQCIQCMECIRVSLQADFPSPKNRVWGYEHPKFWTLTTTDG